MADGWDIATNIINLVSRLPVERLVRRNPEKDLDNFEKRLREKGLLNPTTAPKMTETAPETQSETITTPRTEKVAQSGSTGIVIRQGLDPERLAWQEDAAYEQVWLLEGHLKNNCIACGDDYECCWKHSDFVILIANETLSMTTDPFWQNLKALAQEIRDKSHTDDVQRGTYVAEYPRLAVRLSEFRVPLQKKAMERARPQITLEEAKTLAAQEAAKHVEESWGKEE